MLAQWPLAIRSALIKAINSAFGEVVPTGRQVASIVLVEVTTAYSVWQFSALSLRELSSTNRVSCESVSHWSKRWC